jgi:membrane protein
MTSETPRAETVTTTGAIENQPTDASTGELVQRLSAQLSELVRRELALARAELTAKGKRAGAGAGLGGAAGVVALYGGGALVAAAIAGVATALSVWLAALVIGAVLLVLAGILALVGRGQIRKATPAMPEEAVEGVKKDVAAVREGVRR